MVCNLLLSSSELKSTQDMLPERQLHVCFTVTLVGRELFALSKDVKVYCGIEDITGNLTRSDWGYVLRAVNQNVTYNAYYIENKLL